MRNQRSISQLFGGARSNLIPELKLKFHQVFCAHPRLLASCIVKFKPVQENLNSNAQLIIANPSKQIGFMKKICLVLLVTLTLSYVVSESGFSQVITVLDEDFENPNRFGIPEGWSPGMDPKGIGAKWAIVEEGTSIPNNNTLSFENIHGSYSLYCAGVGFNDGYSSPEYPNNMETMIFTPSINPNERDFQNAQDWTLSWNYLIPSIGNNDLFEVKIKYNDGQELSIFKRNYLEDFLGFENMNITEKIDSRPFQIGFYFYSNRKSEGEEGAYVDDVVLTCLPSEALDLQIPERNAQWIKGETYTLKWESNFSTDEQLDLILYSGGLFLNTQFYIPNTGSYDFTVPENLPGGAGYLFEISKVNNPGVSCYSYPFQIIDKPKSRINSQTTYIDFRTVYKDYDSRSSFSIENIGGAETIVDIEYNGSSAFSTDLSSFSMAPEAIANKEVFFKPSEIGDHEGVLTIKGADNELRLNLRGSSEESPLYSIRISSDTKDFSDVKIGEEEMLSFIIQNEGNASQEVQMAVQGNPAFSLLDPENDKNFLLAHAGEDSRHTVEVSFQPAVRGSHKAEIVAVGTSATTYSVYGNGVLKVDNPSFSHNSGIYTAPIVVSIDWDHISDLRYTTNGLEPGINSPKYYSPIEISTTTTVKAKALTARTFTKSSDQISSTYIIEPILSALRSNLQPGEYYDEINLMLYSPDPGSEIYYTTDGSIPTVTSTMYTGAAIKIQNTTNLKARSFMEGKSPSPLFSGVYDIVDLATVDAWTLINVPFRIYDFDFDNEGKLWAVGEHIYKYIAGEWVEMAASGFGYNYTNIKKDQDGNLLFFEDGGYKLENGELSQIYYRGSHPYTYNIEDILIDNENNIWFATWFEGIIKLAGEEYTRYDNENGLESICYLYEHVGDEEAYQTCREMREGDEQIHFREVHEALNGDLIFIGETEQPKAIVVYVYDGSEFHLRTELFPDPEKYDSNIDEFSSYLGKDSEGYLWFTKDTYNRQSDSYDFSVLRFDGSSFVDVTLPEDEIPPWQYNDWRNLVYSESGDIISYRYDSFTRYLEEEDESYTRIRQDLPPSIFDNTFEPKLVGVCLDNEDNLWLHTRDKDGNVFLAKYIRPVNDISIRVSGYYSGCDLGTDTDLTIEIANLGTKSQSNIIVGANINGQNAFSDKLETTLESEEIQQFEFPYQIDLSREGKNKVEFYGMIEGDQFKGNNVDIKEVFNTKSKNIPWKVYDFNNNHGSSVYSIHTDVFGKLWAWGDMKVWEWNGNSWDIAFDVLKESPSSSWFRLFFNKDGVAWLFTENKVFSNKTGRWQLFTEMVECYEIYFYPGNQGRFLILRHPTDGYQSRLYQFKDGEFYELAGYGGEEFFVEDSKGTLWAASNGQIVSGNGIDSWNYFEIDPEDRVYINNMWIDKDDRIWISLAENRGICTMKDGILDYNNDVTNNSRISSFIETWDNEIWLSLQYSNDVIQIKDAIWTLYNDNNTMLPSKLRAPLFMDSNGDVWFSGSEGIVRFDGSDWDVYNECTKITRPRNIQEGRITEANGQLFFLSDALYSMVDNDLGITEISSPGKHSGLFFNQPVRIEISNNGTQAQSGFDIHCVMDGQEIANDHFTSILQSGESYNHEFSEPIDVSTLGKHELKVYLSNVNDSYPKNDTLEKSFEVMEVASLEGQVSYSTGPVQDAHGIVFLKNNEKLKEYTRFKVDEKGVFFVDNLMPDTAYYFRVNIDNPYRYPTLLNTYYDSSYFWEEAQFITVEENETKLFDFEMVEIPEPESGIGYITGSIYYPTSGFKSKGTTGIKRVENSKSIGDPLPGVDLYLIDETNDLPVQHRSTDDIGRYFFSSLAEKNYSIRVDIPGIPQLSTHMFELNPENTLFTGLDFIVDTVSLSISITDVESYVFLDDIKLTLYPNPSSDFLNIRYVLSEQTQIAISIVDLHGRVIEIEKMENRLTGEYLVQKQIGRFPPGTYFLIFQTKSKIYSKPFIISGN